MRRKVWWMAAAAAAGMLLLTACTSSEDGIVQDSAQVGGDAGLSQDAAVPEDTAGTQQSAQEMQGLAPDMEAPAIEDVEETPDGQDAGSQETGSPQDVSGETQDLWSGTYDAQEESVTITLLDAEHISFAFAQAGISGTASVTGSQAIYKGDDYHVVVFVVSGDTVQVSVTSEEDFDTSDSPLNGTYIRE